VPDNSPANFAGGKDAQTTIGAVQHKNAADAGDGFDRVMIAADYLKRIAAWSRELNERETEVARAGVVERTYRADEFIFMRGDRFDYWTGIVTGLARMGIVSRGGKATSFTGLTAGAWFGEGTVLKNEPRRYDVVALRDTRLAMMDRGTFMWLFENSVGFNRFLVGQLNERLGQFIALLEYGRTLDATARLARGIASLFNPILYPDLTRHLEITQEEIGALSGISRQNANQCLKKLEKEGLLRLEYGGVTILDLERLRRYGE
jgi:CRP/FNR family transcriptional regulator, cyclic AMP receptor protein